MTGILASPDSGNGVVAGLKDGLLMNQFKAIGVTLVLSVVGTAVIALIVKAVLGLRPNEEVETVGLDLTEHGEEGYHGT
jgi:Amt family ammonium transporter